MADGIVYTHDEFIGLLMETIDRQLTVRSRQISRRNEHTAQQSKYCSLNIAEF